MQTGSSTTAPVFPGQIGFAAAFFQTYTPSEELRRGEATEAPRPATSYSAQLYGSHADFCRSDDFGQYRKEMRADLDLLVAFCQEHKMPDAEVIAQRFNVLFEQRFETAYFDNHDESLDSVGKRSLDDFCAMIRDERLPADKRLTAIKNLSEGVEGSASDTVSNLILANRDLALSFGGFRAAAWNMKEALTRSVLQEAVRERFGEAPLHPMVESHYVNAAWNHLAPILGFDPVPDRRAPKLDIDFLKSCQHKVHAAMTPDRIAWLLAEQIQGKFNSECAAQDRQVSGHCDAAVMKEFVDTVNAIRLELDLNEEQLGLHAFVRMDEDTPSYHLYSDPSLIAWHILKAMRTEGLIDDLPVNKGEWLGENGERYALMTYGTELAVRARRPDLATTIGWNRTAAAAMPDGAADFAWHEDAEVDLLTIPALRRWEGAQGAQAERPPYAAIRQALRGADSQDLMETDARWLRDGRSMLELFAQFGDWQIERYLTANLSYVLKEFAEQDRVLLLARVEGSGSAAQKLERAWSVGTEGESPT